MMLANSDPVLVRACNSQVDFDRRHGDRRDAPLDATARPLDAQDTFAWGAHVRDISRTGIGLTICFPFRAGVYLALDIHGATPDRPAKTVLGKVVHTRDQNDGSWHVGCQFVKPLTESELDQLA